MHVLNAGVLPLKSPHRNLVWGFPLGKFLPEIRVLERKRNPNANAIVLGMLRLGH